MLVSTIQWSESALIPCLLDLPPTPPSHPSRSPQRTKLSPLYYKWQLPTSYLSYTWSESESYSVVSDSLWPHGLYSPWNSAGQNIGMGSLSLLQGIFPIQGSNPGLPHGRQILYQLIYQGSPSIQKLPQEALLHYILHMVVYICQSYSPSSFHPLLPPWVHMFVLYICIFIPVLQIGSSALFF